MLQFSKSAINSFTLKNLLLVCILPEQKKKQVTAFYFEHKYDKTDSRPYSNYTIKNCYNHLSLHLLPERKKGQSGFNIEAIRQESYVILTLGFRTRL